MAARSAGQRGQRVAPWVLLSPFLVLFIATYLVPVGYSIAQSLYRTESSGLGFGPTRNVFVGLGNYQHSLTEPAFQSSLGRAALVGAILIPTLILIPLLMALLIDVTGPRWRAFFRMSFFLPYAVPGVIGSIMWGFLYSPGTSPIQSLLDHAGVHSSLVSANTILYSMSNVVLWEYAGFNMLILYAALLTVPSEVLDAANVDGAGPISVALRIKVPIIAPALGVALVFTSIGTLQIFAEPLILRNVAPVITTSFTPNLAAYTEAFSNNNYQLAAAKAILIALVAFALSFTLMRVLRQGPFARDRP